MKFITIAGCLLLCGCGERLNSSTEHVYGRFEIITNSGHRFAIAQGDDSYHSIAVCEVTDASIIKVTPEAK